MLILDKIYAVKIGNNYLSNLYPVLYSDCLKEARTYSTIGPARAVKTKYEKELLKEKRKSVLYIPFPHLVEYGIIELRKI